MRALLIGSNGYIGTELKYYINCSGNRPLVCVDSKLSDGDDNNPTTLVMDYRHLTKQFLSQFSTVILLAAHSSVGMCKGNASSWDNNVTNFKHLLDKLDDQKLIFAGSGSVLSKIDNWYDLAKKQIEEIATMSGKNTYCLRFGTVNGYSQVLREDLMINAMVKTALTTNKINVFEKDAKRPILGMGDLVHGVGKIITSVNKPGTYNLASFNTTVDNVAKVVSQITGAEINYTTSDKASPYSFEMEIDPIFEPQETTISIVNSLLENEPIKRVTRYEPVHYS